MQTIWARLRILGVVVGLLCLLIGSAVSGWAHESEDHGATPPASPSADQTAAMPGHADHIHQGSCDHLEPSPLQTSAYLQFPPEPNGNRVPAK